MESMESHRAHIGFYASRDVSALWDPLFFFHFFKLCLQLRLPRYSYVLILYLYTRLSDLMTKRTTFQEGVLDYLFIPSSR